MKHLISWLCNLVVQLLGFLIQLSGRDYARHIGPQMTGTRIMILVKIILINVRKPVQFND